MPPVAAPKLRSSRWLEATGVRGFLRRSSLRVHGLAETDFANRPIVGIANNWSEFNRCHLHFGMLTAAIKQGVWQAGGLPIEFPTMTMSADLASPSSFINRNLLAMEVEQSVRTYPMDAVVMLGACDDTIPGMLMAAASLDLPTIILPGGPGMNGNWRGEAVGSGTDTRRFFTALQRGEITSDDWTELESSIDRTPGHCTTMGTAATMACIAEALGMAILGSAAIPAVDSRKLRVAHYIGRRAVALINEDRRPSSIMTGAALENAVRVMSALGGSTNAIIHLCALAGRLGLDLPLSMVDRISHETPVIGNIKPAGEYLMEDFFDAGGVPAVLKELQPLLNLDVESVNEIPMREGIERATNRNRTVIRSIEDPLSESGGLAILRGTLAPGGAVLRVATASADLLHHTGRAVVFTDVDDMQNRLNDPTLEIRDDDILVLKGGGPKGGSGMPAWGWFPIPERIVRRGVQDMIRASDSRMSGTAYGTVVLHITPEAAERGPLAVVETGDRIRLDTDKRSFDLLVTPREVARRLTKWTPRGVLAERGYARLYVDHVLSVEKGCDFDFLVGKTPAGAAETKVRAL